MYRAEKQRELFLTCMCRPQTSCFAITVGSANQGGGCPRLAPRAKAPKNCHLSKNPESLLGCGERPAMPRSESYRRGGLLVDSFMGQQVEVKVIAGTQGHLLKLQLCPVPWASPTVRYLMCSLACLVRYEYLCSPSWGILCFLHPIACCLLS